MVPLLAGSNWGTDVRVQGFEADPDTDVNSRFNEIGPGYFRTELTEAFYTDAGWQERMLARIPAGRFGDPAEMGDVCAYLCGAQAGFMTGQNVLVDGGKFPGTL